MVCSCYYLVILCDSRRSFMCLQDELPTGLLTPLRRESQSSSGSETQEATLQVSLQPVSHTETVIATTPTPPTSPRPPLPSILEAAIKAEPKVEVERIASPGAEETVPQARYVLFRPSLLHPCSFLPKTLIFLSVISIKKKIMHIKIVPKCGYCT